LKINNRIIFCHASLTDEDSLWREIFNKEGIKTGNKYKLKEVVFDSFLSPWFDSMTDLLKMNIEKHSFKYKLKKIAFDIFLSPWFDHDQAKSRDDLMKKEKETVQFDGNEYSNPRSILQDMDALSNLTKDQSRLAYGDVNLDNIAFLEKSENEDKFHPVFLNLASIGTDYPISFDMAKLEVEIKKHMITTPELEKFFMNHTRQWFSLLLCIEQYLHLETDDDTLCQTIKEIDDPETKKTILQMICLIKKIRKNAYKLYERKENTLEAKSKPDQRIKECYFQQLFFCNLQALSYKELEEPSKFYLSISSLYTATELFAPKKTYSYKKRDVEPSFKTNKIFISYSHKDEEWLRKIYNYLKPLKHNNLKIWYDKEKIKTGDDWKNTILKNIDDAHMAICLVSKNFLKSDFIRENEIPAICKMKESNGLTIFPILIEECEWNYVDWLKKIQMFTFENAPLNTVTEDQEEVLTDKLLKEISNKLADTSHKPDLCDDL